MSISSRTRSKVAEAAMARWRNLPEEIYDEIFLRLPANSILQLRCVCKLFHSLLTEPNFIRNHVNRTIQSKNSNPKLLFGNSSESFGFPDICSLPIDYASISSSLSSCFSCQLDGAAVLKVNNPFESEADSESEFEPTRLYDIDLLGSCDGLVCFKFTCLTKKEFWHTEETNYFGILNPLTREFKEFEMPGYSSCAAYGFGYDSVIDDYKLVAIWDNVTTGFSDIEVYTVRSDSRSSTQGNMDYSFCRLDGSVIPVGYSIGMGKGALPRAVYLKGHLHWLVRINTPKTSSEALLSFDISNETMVHMPLPGNIMPPIDFQEGQVYKHVGVRGDCICVAFFWDIVRMDVWVMQEYGVMESWINVFTKTQLPLSPYIKPLFYFNDGEILVDYLSEELLLFDPDGSMVVRHITMCDIGETYVETIVSLGSGTYLERKITDRTVKNRKRQQLR